MFACQSSILRFVKFTTLVMIVSEFVIEHALTWQNIVPELSSFYSEYFLPELQLLMFTLPQLIYPSYNPHIRPSVRIRVLP